MNYKKSLVKVGLTAACLIGSVVPAYADGTKKVCTTQYNGATTCEEVTEVTRPTPELTKEVETGIVENMAIATGLFVAGYALMIAAQKQARVA